MMWMVCQEYRHVNGRVKENAHLTLSENRKIPFAPDGFKSVIHDQEIKRMP